MFSQTFGSVLLGGTHIPYKDTVETEANPNSGKLGFRSKDAKFVNYRYNCITRMQQYESKSFEELRCEDYLAKRKTGYKTLFPPSSTSTKLNFGASFSSSTTPTPMNISPSPSTSTFNFGSSFSAPANTSSFGVQTPQSNPAFTFNKQQPFGSLGQTTFGSTFGQNSFALPNPFLNQNKPFQFNIPQPQTPSPFGNFGVPQTTAPLQVPQFQFPPPTPPPTTITNTGFPFASPPPNPFQQPQYFNPWIPSGWPGYPYQANVYGPGSYQVIPVPLYCPPPVYPQDSSYSINMPGFHIPLSCAPHRELPSWNCDKETFDKAMKKASDVLAPYLHITKHTQTPKLQIRSSREKSSGLVGDKAEADNLMKDKMANTMELENTSGIWGSVPQQHNSREFIDILTPKPKTTFNNLRVLNMRRVTLMSTTKKNTQVDKDTNSAVVVENEVPMEIQNATYEGPLLHIPVGKSIPACKHCGRSSSGDNEPELEKKDTNRSCGVILTDKDHYCKPSIKELDSLTDESGNCMVENFCVGHSKYGKVVFEGTMNVAGLNLDRLIKFSYKEFNVYPDTDLPEAGMELNRPCVVTLEGIWPWSKDKGCKVKNVLELKEMDFEKRLRNACTRFQGEFISYNPESGCWTFKIKQFME